MTNELPEYDYQRDNPTSSNARATVAKWVGIGAVLGAIGLGAITLDRKERKDTIDGYYKRAEQSRADHFNGYHDLARTHHEEMWRVINQDRRDKLRDFWGRITDNEMSYLEENLDSTYVFSKRPLVKPVVK